MTNKANISTLACVGAFWIFLSPSLFVQADDWGRFRGPNGNGYSAEAKFPATFKIEDALWQCPVPGNGNSSPVVGGGNIYVTSADPETSERKLTAIAVKSGKNAWSVEFPLQVFKAHKRNGFASSTPCADERHVYVLWQSATNSAIHALNHAGKKVWTYELGGFAAGPGCATSPILHGGRLLLTHDNEKHESFLLALDADTGTECWKTLRKTQRTGFSTPVIYQGKSGETQVIFSHAYEGVVAVDFEKGEILWQNIVFGDHQQRAIGSPIVANGLVIAASGFTTGVKTLVALDPESVDGDGQAREVYRLMRNVPHCPTPLVVGGLMFLWTDRGILACLEAETGKEVWAKRIGGEFFASPVCAGGTIYGVDRDGVVTAVAASREYKLLGKTELPAGSMATPAIVDGKLIYRTSGGVIAFGP
ncbi:MAG: PQQ-binding-like beta-propeller repeat protein [Planctomycetaceae bacterium]|jgi:outer membrane protein assembly factor BamB|nr:PQQ-binding-like beta-propeller repeat protein [Planctomycetaceae bacterium]